MKGGYWSKNNNSFSWKYERRLQIYQVLHCIKRYGCWLVVHAASINRVINTALVIRNYNCVINGNQDEDFTGRRACQFFLCWCCWSLLYSAILHSRADSLHSHVILQESLDFKSFFCCCFYLSFSFFLHQSGVLTVLAWPVPHETAAVLACSVYTIQPCTMSLHAKPHM